MHAPVCPNLLCRDAKLSMQDYNDLGSNSFFHLIWLNIRLRNGTTLLTWSTAPLLLCLENDINAQGKQPVHEMPATTFGCFSISTVTERAVECVPCTSCHLCTARHFCYTVCCAKMHVVQHYCDWHYRGDAPEFLLGTPQLISSTSSYLG